MNYNLESKAALLDLLLEAMKSDDGPALTAKDVREEIDTFMFEVENRINILTYKRNSNFDYNLGPWYDSDRFDNLIFKTSSFFLYWFNKSIKKYSFIATAWFLYCIASNPQQQVNFQ